MALESPLMHSCRPARPDYLARNPVQLQVQNCVFRSKVDGRRGNISHLPRSFEAANRRRRGRVIAAVEESGSNTAVPNLRRKLPVKEVLLVDPLVAKRMAEEDMQRRIRRTQHQRQRRVEAINGGWAMIGLTTGLVVEGMTNQGIISQVSSYLDSVALFFEQLASSV